jgi:hypothetical protein
VFLRALTRISVLLDFDVLIAVSFEMWRLHLQGRRVSQASSPASWAVVHTAYCRMIWQMNDRLVSMWSWLYRGTIATFAWIDWRRLRIHKIRLIAIPAEIRKEHLPNTNIERYRCAKPLGLCFSLDSLLGFPFDPADRGSTFVTRRQTSTRLYGATSQKMVHFSFCTVLYSVFYIRTHLAWIKKCIYMF